jgi:pimeloyl-ACP methyl ester carboxylesterase
VHQAELEKILIDSVQLEALHLPGPAEAGQPTLVFLHEGLGSVRMWRDWPARLCAQIGCSGWVYSRLGYGQSDPVVDVRGPSVQVGAQRRGRLLPDYLHREAWEVLPALLEQLGLVQPVLLGHSDGASIALLHAARFPVRACIAMAPHVMVEDQSIQSIAQAREAFLHGDLRARLTRHHADVDGAFWQWNDAWLNPAFRGFDIRADCTRITAPVLALQGDLDPYGTMAQIDQIDLPAHRIRRVALAGCGHSPHREAPAATLAAAVDFLSRID